MKVPDTDRNRSWIGRIRYRMSWAGYPTLRLMALAETGTRGLLGATVGSVTDRDEITPGPPAAARCCARACWSCWTAASTPAGFFAEITRTGAMLLCPGPCLPQARRSCEHLPDGSYLSCLDGLAVRIIEAGVVVTGADGTRIADSYRLITTLTDHRRYPAAALVRLYHERWGAT